MPINIDKEVADLRARIASMKNREDQIIDEFKAAQGQLFALARQGEFPSRLEEPRTAAISYYEAFLDQQIEINVLMKRLEDLTS